MQTGFSARCANARESGTTGLRWTGRRDTGTWRPVGGSGKGAAPSGCLRKLARFRVTTLQNAYLFRPELAKQLWRQPELKILDLPTIRFGEEDEFRVLDDSKVLPKLIALGVDATVPPENLPRSRRLENSVGIGTVAVGYGAPTNTPQIGLECRAMNHSCSPADVMYLRTSPYRTPYRTVAGLAPPYRIRFSASLTTLTLVHLQFMRAIFAMPLLAVSLPHLVHLAITDEFEDAFKNTSSQEQWEKSMFPQYEASALPILHALPGFDRLETLVLYTYGARPSVFRDYTINLTPPLTLAMPARAFAFLLMAKNAHLRRVHLGVFDLAFKLAPKVLMVKEIYRSRICEATYSLWRNMVEERTGSTAEPRRTVAPDAQ
uniref:Uncharacterized protein n=1 Tax=Mycena chlorophos TaxID=658473 RepID=A0ABQ0LEF3_MYCCL|nr:predicted protein [Mycena chlorophos]